jgi:ethanolamine utilization protein EutN
VATVKNDSLDGRKLLIVQTVDRNLESSGKPMVAIDSVGAGVGELVFWCRGKEASIPFKREDTPTDCTIVGIVDSEQHETRLFSHAWLEMSSRRKRTGVTRVRV